MRPSTSCASAGSPRLRQPGLHRGGLPRRPAGRHALRARRCTRARWWAWPPATRSAAASRRSSSCTPPPGSATRSPRWPPRASTGRRWWCWSASRTAAISPRSRSSRGGCTASPGSTPCGSTSRCARRTCPGALARAWHEARTRPRPALVIVPMDDWLAPAPRGPRGRRAAAPAARARGRPRRRRRAGGPARPTRARRRWWWARAPTAPEAWAALVELAERLGRARLAGVLRRARRLPAGPSPLRRATCRPAGPGCADARRPRRRPGRRGRLRSASTPTSPGRWSRRARAWRSSPTIPPRRTAARSSWPCWPLPPQSVASSPAWCPSAPRAAPAPMARPEAPEPPGPGEPLRAGHVLAALAERAAARRRPGRGGAVGAPRPAGALPARAGRLASWPRPWAGSGSACPLRSACAWRCRTGPSWRSSATAPRCTRSRRSGARPATRSARSSWCSPTAATGSMDRLAEGQGEAAPWPAFGSSTSRPWPARRAARRARRDPRRAGRVRSTTAFSGLAERTQPLLLEVVVAPGTRTSGPSADRQSGPASFVPRPGALSTSSAAVERADAVGEPAQARARRRGRRRRRRRPRSPREHARRAGPPARPPAPACAWRPRSSAPPRRRSRPRPPPPPGARSRRPPRPSTGTAAPASRAPRAPPPARGRPAPAGGGRAPARAAPRSPRPARGLAASSSSRGLGGIGVELRAHHPQLERRARRAAAARRRAGRAPRGGARRSRPRRCAPATRAARPAAPAARRRGARSRPPRRRPPRASSAARPARRRTDSAEQCQQRAANR